MGVQGWRRVGFKALGFVSAAVVIGVIAAACGTSDNNNGNTGGLPNGPATLAQVLLGRHLTLAGGCADCHNRGVDDPNGANWLAGFIGTANDSGQGAFDIGPFKTFAANLTPDMTNGIGMHTDRQIFNALRFGLDPEETPSAVITGTTPGQGNFPATPFYLGPPMPWPAFRNCSDDELWAIVAYLKHGVRADPNEVAEGTSPGDHWAGSFSTLPIFPTPAFPLSGEQFQP